jgi:type 1 fimbria pilin
MFKPTILIANFSALSLMIALVPNVSGMTDQYDWGRITMEGSILNAACTISAENIDQVINLEVVAPKKTMLQHDEEITKSFSVDLTHCVLSPRNEQVAAKQFHITVDADEAAIESEKNRSVAQSSIVENKTLNHVTYYSLKIISKNITRTFYKDKKTMRLNLSYF